VYPGFPADVLWKFRWYLLLNQLLIWSATGLILGALLERFLRPARRHDNALGGQTVAIAR
jgi:hypothetical protein